MASVSVSGRPNLVFDLDNTLIFALDPDELEDADRKGVDLSLFETSNMDDEFTIVSRPRLQEFLDWVFARFRVSVFTAASNHYGAYITDNILLRGDKNRKRWFSTFLARPHFKESIDVYGIPKSLELLFERYALEGFTAQNTVLLDDLLDCAVGSNRCNVISCEYFVATDKDAHRDDFLMGKVKPLLEKFLGYHASGSGGMCLLTDIRKR